MRSVRNTYEIAHTTPHVVVVGAGMGGLSAAVDLAASGARVTLIERAQTVGGKVRSVEVESRGIDAGPTVITMKDVFEDLFACAGDHLEDRLELAPLDILARHAWPDGTQFDLFADAGRAEEEVARVFGGDAARGYLRFVAYARGLYQEVEHPVMRASKPSLLRAAWTIGMRGPASIRRLDWRRTMWSALGEFFPDPRLRQLFGRYATYYGSSPFSAPATLNLIAHAEKLGVWTAKGGMRALAGAVEDLAKRLHVEIRTATHVREIRCERGRATGVVLESGESLEADAVVSNVDPAALSAGRLGVGATRAGRPMPPRARSLSAMTWCSVARPAGVDLEYHNVFFSDDYAAEFEALMGAREVPSEPTVYICAQDRAPSQEVSTGQRERLLLLINAPADGDQARFSDHVVNQCRNNATRLLTRCGLELHDEASVVTTPAQFHELFPDTGGALYGAATHRTLAPFSRPTAKTKVRGLYLVGGGVHPGAGVPMVTMGGRIAANEVRKDLASINGWTPAATSGGISTSSRTTGATR